MTLAGCPVRLRLAIWRLGVTRVESSSFAVVGRSTFDRGERAVALPAVGFRTDCQRQRVQVQASLEYCLTHARNFSGLPAILV